MLTFLIHRFSFGSNLLLMCFSLEAEILGSNAVLITSENTVLLSVCIVLSGCFLVCPNLASLPVVFLEEVPRISKS